MTGDNSQQQKRELQAVVDQCQQENQDLLDLLMTLKQSAEAIHFITMLEITNSLKSPIRANADTVLRTVALIALDAIHEIKTLEDKMEELSELPF